MDQHEDDGDFHRGNNEDSKLLVQRGYDTIAQTYLKWTTGKPTARLIYLERLLSRMPEVASARVLELGCGAGVPGTRLLAQRCGQITANDISQAQVDLARVNVPDRNIDFIAGDMTMLALRPAAFEAVVAFYSIIHLPRNEHRSMFAQICNWLSPGGQLLCNLGVGDNPGSTTENWLGARMYWSGFDTETNLDILREVGFDIVESEVLYDDEDGRLVPFLWILAQKR